MEWEIGSMGKDNKRRDLRIHPNRDCRDIWETSCKSFRHGIGFYLFFTGWTNGGSAVGRALGITHVTPEMLGCELIGHRTITPDHVSGPESGVRSKTLSVLLVEKKPGSGSDCPAVRLSRPIFFPVLRLIPDSRREVALTSKTSPHPPLFQNIPLPLLTSPDY